MSVFIIAEIGINHNGNLDIAKDLIDSSINAGADLVKFQKRTIDLVYTKDMLDSPRESPWGATQREQKKGLEFGYDEYQEIDSYCKEKGIKWFASAWDLESQKFLKNFDLKFNKIASAMNVFSNLLEAVSEEKKHTFISTGMCTAKEIDNAVNIFSKNDCQFTLMHCVSTYPMDTDDANLNAINTLRDKYNCPVGYSGHEVGLTVSLAAAAMGITALERHITLDRSMYGSDQASSIEPHGFKKLVSAIRVIENSFGDGKLGYTKKELSIAEKLRGHIPWSSVE